MNKFVYAVGVAGVCVFISPTWAGNVLIVNGASTTSETDTTSEITTNLPPTCGPSHTYTVADTPPVSLTGYDQIWDLRFSNASPLTAADRAAYLAFLQAGGNMFVMGENDGFPTRNNSITAFVNQVGGGNLTFQAVGDNQTVNSPFTNGGLTNIIFRAGGGTTTSGTGIFATNNANGGTALAWANGTLGNAPAGSLTVVFDVNFMQPSGSSEEHQFFENLCDFVATGGGTTTPVAATPVPVDAPFALLALSGLLGFAGWRAARKAAA